MVGDVVEPLSPESVEEEVVEALQAGVQLLVCQRGQQHYWRVSSPVFERFVK